MTIYGRRADGRHLLFANRDLRDYLDPQTQEMMGEIANYDKSALLNTQTDELAQYFAEKYRFELTELNEDEISAQEDETKIEITHNFEYMWDGDGPGYADGTKITVSIPFTGQREFLFCNPNQLYMGAPVEAAIEGGSIVFSVSSLPQHQSQIKPEIDNRIKIIKDRLQMMRDDVNNYNNGLLSQATQAIDARKAKLKENSSLVSSLGFKVARRDDAPRTYAVPDIKRKFQPPVPKTSSAAQLEPTLPTKEFEHILKVVTNMVMVMERSPKTFVNMDEEAIRDHFLVQLNGQYEGQATGETFNGSGKTDIIIKNEGKNVFIAECKFWDGPEVFKSALRQLLSYATWRDGKLALLIFNRNKNLTGVIKQIRPLIEADNNFVSFEAQKSETEFHFTMSHPSDKDKHLILAVLVFDIPNS